MKEDKHILQIPAFHIPGIDLIVCGAIRLCGSQHLTDSIQAHEFEPLGVPVLVDLIDIDFQRLCSSFRFKPTLIFSWSLTSLPHLGGSSQISYWSRRPPTIPAAAPRPMGIIIQMEPQNLDLRVICQIPGQSHRHHVLPLGDKHSRKGQQVILVPVFSFK